MEQSPAKFHKFPDTYTHIFYQQSNTGLEMNLLQNYIFVPLDILRDSVQNKGIRNRLDAWLAFFSMDSPEIVEELITKFPDFKAMYEHIYSICNNVERVMNMYSEELRILDRNTVQYMVDQMQEQIDQQNKQIDSQSRQINAQREELDAANRKILELTRQLQQMT